MPAPPAETRRLTQVCLVGAVLGVVTMLLGLVWPALGGGRLVYSPDQAQEYKDAGVALHAATSGHVHAESDPGQQAHEPTVPPEEREAAVAAARQRFERAEAALETARFAQDNLGHWLLGAGLAATIAFGIGYMASRGE